MAWRIRGNVVLLIGPGPKKVQPFDSSVLDTEIQLLDHGVKTERGNNRPLPTVLSQCVTAGAGVDGEAGAARPGGGSSEADAAGRMADARGGVGHGLHGIRPGPGAVKFICTTRRI